MNRCVIQLGIERWHWSPGGALLWHPPKTKWRRRVNGLHNTISNFSSEWLYTMIVKCMTDSDDSHCGALYTALCINPVFREKPCLESCRIYRSSLAWNGTPLLLDANSPYNFTPTIYYASWHHGRRCRCDVNMNGRTLESMPSVKQPGLSLIHASW